MNAERALSALRTIAQQTYLQMRLKKALKTVGT